MKSDEIREEIKRKEEELKKVERKELTDKMAEITRRMIENGWRLRCEAPTSGEPFVSWKGRYYGKANAFAITLRNNGSWNNAEHIGVALIEECFDLWRPIEGCPTNASLLPKKE